MSKIESLPFIIGLTGGIGSGKTLVSELFASLGVAVIDTDQLSRDLVAPGTPALVKITEYFGTQVLQKSGELNRKNLRKLVFADEKKRRWLEALLHPLIKQAAMQELTKCQGKYAVLVVPLLLESRDYQFVNRILVVDCEEKLQEERVMQRDQCSRETAKKILSTQLPRELRLAAADDIIENNDTIDDLRIKVEKLHEKYQQLSTRKNY
ncbi:MAG: dephospho-CoA kinase [Gammaproteobacteria bacterium]|nr:dephospho-CoA kinase [Gammaproteobacteria bacterium]MAY02274.1 dephospho-CoA kinase [Gammaproteobacteria bacterium]|tara:strand:- start:1990 stop:2616 length:627 start_codon:yes stop_codon:yes gene_type:complete